MTVPDTVVVADDVARPRHHLTPRQGWLSDPVGLLYHEGVYHCAYQHYPHGLDWGPMHWGHATSTDLLTWVDAGVALAPDADGFIYSGSAVVDEDGVAGYGGGAMIAYFTLHSGSLEAQSFAVSVDSGRSWQRPERSPVLSPPPGVADFRDPRVFLWDGTAGRRWWIMLLAVGGSIQFYRSTDLRSWELVSTFLAGTGPNETWETPDLIPLHGESEAGDGWVLTIGVLIDGPGSATCMRYFVGDFDGIAFVRGPDCEAALVDHGPDFYAGQSWSHAPDPTWTGWVNNWAYARELPAVGWKGVLAIPRRLSLRTIDGRRRLRQSPVRPGLPAVPEQRNLTVDGSRFRASAHLDATCTIPEDASGEVRLHLIGSDSRSVTLIWVPGEQASLRLDLRSVRGEAYGSVVPRVFTAPLLQEQGPTAVRILLDGCVLEVFADDGLTVLTALLPQDWTLEEIEVDSARDAGEVAVSIWHGQLGDTVVPGEAIHRLT